jgi:hypothetical protein
MRQRDIKGRRLAARASGARTANSWALVRRAHQQMDTPPRKRARRFQTIPGG